MLLLIVWLGLVTARTVRMTFQEFSSCAIAILLFLKILKKDVEVRGFNVVFINLSGTAVLDWCDDELFRRVRDRITGGEFVAVVLSPPFLTFCRRFRGCIGTDVYGLKGLQPDDKEVVRTETLVVFRCIEVLLIIHSLCIPWVLILPATPSFVFQLPEMHGLVQSPGVFERTLDVGDVLVGNVNGECRSLVDSVTSGIRESAVLPNNEPGSEPWPLEATVVEMDTQLRGSVVNPKSLRKVEDEECIGGMVRAARAVASLPGNLVVGGQVKKIVDSFLVEFPHVIDDCYHAVGSDSENAGPKLQDVEAFRIRLGKHFGTEDWGPTCEDCTSSICHGLLSAWANLAQDPGKVAADWVRHGAPAGILSQPLLPGVFPLAQPSDEDVLEPEDLEGDVEIFRNYAGMDEDENVWSQVHEFVEKGFLKAFDSLHECEGFLGGTPVLSRFGQVTKVRFGKLKRRLTLDVKQSRVKDGTRKVHRVPLPRATDVVCDIMDMLHKHPLGTDEQLDLLVLDFVDAFWNVPLMASERRFFVGKLRSRYFVFLRAAQGSRNGPLAWAGVVSLAIRLVQACLWEGGECPARINTYVDDPLTVVRGTETRRNYLVACLVLLFTALGFPLSFRKGSRGTSVDWIGLNLSVRPRVVHLAIAEARVKELRDLAEEALLHNLVSKKWLKSFAGKASSFASILCFWRPFLRSIWTAIYAVPSDGTPRNCVWVKQFVVAVKWIRAFLNGVQGNMVRVFDLDVYAGVGPFARMVFDASPWGAGGFLVVDGKFVS